jgi:hypothetical protein
MKTKITETVYTTSHGGKNQSITCCVCHKHMRSYAATHKIRGEKIGVYCSPQCIDREILSRRGASFSDASWIEIVAGRKI